MGQLPLWHALDQEAQAPAPGRLNLWTWIREKLDIAQFRPAPASDVVAQQLTGREGDYIILKNNQAKTYYRLTDRDYFLWQLMDGERSVKDLVVEYFMRYGTFAFARVASLVNGLRYNGFLSEEPINVYRQVETQLQRRHPTFYLKQIWKGFLQMQFAIGGLDRLLGGLYRYGGFLFFTLPMQIIYLLVSVVGFGLFIRTFNTGGYSLLSAAGSIALGFLVLLIAQFISIFLHEMAHALTVKHYKREVRRAGVMVYFGLPAFFVDTTDIWLEGKRARLAVSWAGPYSGLILSGLAAIAITVWPDFPFNPLLFKFAFLTYLLVFINLNPLLELDGYYMLMDWLEIPLLRRKSFEFLRTGLTARLKQISRTAETRRNPLGYLRLGSREERIFVIFGVLSAIWTGYAIYSGLRFWQVRLSSSVNALLAEQGSLTGLILTIFLVLLSAVFVLTIGLYPLQILRNALRNIGRQPALQNTWVVAVILLVACFGLVLLPGWLEYAWVQPVLVISGCLVALTYALRNARKYIGSRFSAVFWCFAVAALALLVGLISNQDDWLSFMPPRILDWISWICTVMTGLALLFAGGILLVHAEFGRAHWKQTVLVVAGLLVAAGGVVYLLFQGGSGDFRSTVTMLARALFPWLGFVFLIPTLFSFWKTRFAPAWFGLAMAMIVLSASMIWGFSGIMAVYLLAAALYLHDLAYQRISHLEGQTEPALDMDEYRRLGRAFSWVGEGVFTQFSQAAGEHASAHLEERLNAQSAVAGWNISLINGHFQQQLPEHLTLLERGSLYAGVLNAEIDLVAQEIGEPIARHALRQAYDRLPWDEREVGAQYLFPHVRGARRLNQAFQQAADDYHDLLRKMPLFANMTEEEISLLISQLKLEKHAAGKDIIRQGEPGYRFYILHSGHVEVIQLDENGVSTVINQLDRGNYFGELALLEDAPRSATCRAIVASQTLSLSRVDFDQLVKNRFAIREKIHTNMRRENLIRRIPLFNELDGSQIQQVAAELRVEEFAEGATIIRQGEIGESFYIIESGRIQVSVEQNGVSQIAGERGPGEFFGEIALLYSTPRTASVTALRPTRVLALHKDDFDRLVGEHLYIRRGLERDSSRRLQIQQRVSPAAQ